jgi:hypothetical protein
MTAAAAGAESAGRGRGNLAAVTADTPERGTRVPGSPSWSYRPGVGVWRESSRVLDWCPTVTRHLVTHSARGEITSRRVSLAIGEVTATVPMADVADGTVWVNRFPMAAGVAGRDVREVLRNIIDGQAAALPLTSALPRWDGGALVLPPGDVLPRGYAVTAGTRDDFRAILRAAARGPRIALAMGLAVAGLYVDPLGRQSYVVHLPGGSSAGKTTAANAAAAIFGNPANVLLPWNATENGVAAWLRGLAVLPGFRDELGASGLRPEKISSMVFRATQGAERDVSSRTGEHRESLGGWHGALISTGNEGIVGRIANEGIAARVVEIAAPLTIDAAHARELDALCRAGHGHGLAELVDRAMTPAEFGEWIDKATAEMDLPAGGPERRVGEHIAGGLAGARLLAEVFDVPEFGEVVPDVARIVLAELVAGLAERGARPGDRLLAAVADAMAARPAEFPSRSDYEGIVSGTKVGNLREVVGWDLSSDSLPGEVAIIPSRLGSICEPAGIEDVGIALRELRTRGLLLPARESLQRLVKVSGKPRRTYVLTGITPAEEPAEVAGNNPDPEPVTGPVTGPVTPSEQGGNRCNRSAGDEMYTREGQPELPITEAAAAPVAEPCEACRRPGDWCGLGVVASEPVPCIGCGQPTKIRSACGAPRTAVCHGPAESTSAPVPAQRPAAAPVTRPAAAPAAQRASGVARAVELANFARVISTRFAEPDADTLAVGLDTFHRVTDGLEIRGGGTMVGVLAWHRANARAGTYRSTDQEPSLPPVDLTALDFKPVNSFIHVRAAVVPEPGQQVTAMDVTGQYLAAAGTIDLGTGQPAHRVGEAVTADVLKLPGYAQLGSVPADMPAGFTGLKPGDWLTMPVARYLAGTATGDLGLSIELAEAWVWDKGNHRRWLNSWTNVFRTAHVALSGQTDLPSRYAMAAVKAIYTGFLGGMLRSAKANHTATLRPDWTDQIVGRAWANLYRGLDKADREPFCVWRDTAYYLDSTAPSIPTGLPVDGLGRFRIDKIAPVTDDLIRAHAAGRPGKVRDAVTAAATASTTTTGEAARA